MAGDLVSASGESIQRWQAALNHITGQYQDAHTKLVQHANSIKDDGTWQGKIAQQYRSDIHPKLISDLKNLQDSLQKMAQSGHQVTHNIHRAGGNS